MTRSQDFDAMSAHYGYGPVCAVLSQRFEFTTTAHHPITSVSSSSRLRGMARGNPRPTLPVGTSS
jgi:hypothetical protein